MNQPSCGPCRGGVGERRRRCVGCVGLVILLAAAGSAHAQHEEEAGTRLERVWRQRVEVLEPRRFDRQGALEIAVGAALVPNDALRVYVPLGLRLTYHAGRQLGVEASVSYAWAAERAVGTFVQRAAAPWREERQQLRVAADLVWTPAYGKLSGGLHVIAIEPYLAVGAGIVRSQAEPAAAIEAAVRPELNAALGIRLGFGRRWLLRLELRQHMRWRPAGQGPATGGLGWPLELGVWGGVLLGGGTPTSGGIERLTGSSV